MKTIIKYFSVAAIYLLLCSVAMISGCDDKKTGNPVDEEYETVTANPRVAVLGNVSELDELEINSEFTVNFYVHAPAGIKSVVSVLLSDLSDSDEITDIPVSSSDLTEMYPSVTFTARRKLKGVSMRIVDMNNNSREAVFPVHRVTGAPLDIFMEGNSYSVVGVLNKFFYISGEVVSVNGLKELFYTPYVNGAAQAPVPIGIGSDNNRVSFTIRHRVDEGLEKLEITMIDETGDEIHQSIKIIDSEGNPTFVPIERQVLEDNGITVFNTRAVASVEQLAYPFHTRSLQDLYYFPNLKVLDFTNGSIIEVKNRMPTLSFTYRYGVPPAVFTNNGGYWQPYLKLCDPISLPSKILLADLLADGSLEKIYYIPGSMDLDDVLAPYVDSGVVELITPETHPSLFPDEAPIDYASWLNTTVYSAGYAVNLSYPARDYGIYNVNGYLINTKTVYRLTLTGNEGGLAFELPKEYRFNKDIYKYLKFKVFTATPVEVLEASINSIPVNRYLNFQVRIGNTMYGYETNSTHGGQQDYINGTNTGTSALGPALTIKPDQLSSWTDYSRIMATNAAGDPQWQRMILIQPGAGNVPSAADFAAIEINGVTGLSGRLVYYFADIRLSKNP
ncbi:MAG: hypothetical protein LBL04_01635 [Bacteroidales bacterium]|jgi:hypothetical protein|nr:hypothetical protein [Bacteroidales bacterium]